MDNWLKDVFEDANIKYDSLPEWKQKAIIDDEMQQAQLARTRQRVETNCLRDIDNDWV